MLSKSILYRKISRFYIKVFSIIILLFVTGCFYDKIDSREISFVNKSTDAVYVIMSSNDSVSTLNHYSGFPNRDNKTYTFKAIASDSTSTPNDRPRDWDALFQKSKNKKIRLFIITKRDVDKYGWKKILDKNIYNKKYEFSVEDLEKLNWNLDYRG